MHTKKLLILTQAVDTQDPVLGFFHAWIEGLAKHYESVSVICLKEGRHSLPDNVRVYSLGKEGGRSRLKYVARFYRYSWQLRKEYDSVFVHMNEEYALLGGALWKLLGKRVYLWRNYHKGSVFTDIAAAFCTNVFCTSKHSYTAKYKKTILMPVGVDTTRFFPDARVPQQLNSILFLSGMWPSKRPEMLIDALALLKKEEVAFAADFYGSPLPDGTSYYESVKKCAADSGAGESIAFHPAVPNDKTPDVYRAHKIFVNCSPSGMFDKTLFEAAACGCTVLSSSKDFADIAGENTYFDSAEALAKLLRGALSSAVVQNNAELVKQHGLSTLIDKLARTL